MLRFLSSGGGVQLATSGMPAPEGAGTVGSAKTAAPADHVHPRISVAVRGTLNSSGEATVSFSRAFDVVPAYTFAYSEVVDNPPVILKVKSWTVVGGQYVGCQVKGYRASILPALSGILLVGPLVSALAGFNVFGGSAMGVEFSMIAINPG